MPRVMSKDVKASWSFTLSVCLAKWWTQSFRFNVFCNDNMCKSRELLLVLYTTCKSQLPANKTFASSATLPCKLVSITVTDY